MDIDRRTRLFGRLRFLGFCAFGASIVYIFLKISPLIGVLMVPLFARFAATYIVHGLLDDVPYLGRRLRYRHWNGKYYEFDGRQIRVEAFDGDISQLPMMAVADLEGLFKDKARFRIKDGIVPQAGTLQGIASVRADKALAWAQMISRTSNAQANRGLKLALYIERTFVNPKLKDDHLNTVKGPNPGLWGLKARDNPEITARDDL